MGVDSVESVTSWWGLGAVAIIVGIPAFFGWLQTSTMRGSAKKDKPAEVAITGLEGRLVDVLALQAEERSKDRQKIAKLEREMDEIRPIVTVKYPIALNHIKAFHSLFPASGLHVPEQIKDDLD